MKVDPFTDPSEITSEMTSRMIFAHGAMRMPLLTVFAAFMLDMQGVAQLPVLNELMTSNQTAFQEDVFRLISTIGWRFTTLVNWFNLPVITSLMTETI